MFCSFLCYNAQNDILSLSSRIDKFVYPSTDFSSLHNTQKKLLSALIFLSCTSLLKFYGISFKDLFLFLASR